jgi:dihydrofolate reductase
MILDPSSSAFAVSGVPKTLNLIVACAENRVIGRDGKLPWRIPEDLRFFETQTAGTICILGRICFETWPRAALDGRQPVVVTRQRALERPGVHVVPSLPAALALADSLPGEIYICGGQRIYEETLALAGSRPLRLHLTLVHAEVPGDTFFPEWRHLPWREIDKRESADANWRYTFFTLDL